MQLNQIDAIIIWQIWFYALPGYDSSELFKKAFYHDWNLSIVSLACQILL